MRYMHTNASRKTTKNKSSECARDWLHCKSMMEFCIKEFSASLFYDHIDTALIYLYIDIYMHVCTNVHIDFCVCSIGMVPPFLLALSLTVDSNCNVHNSCDYRFNMIRFGATMTRFLSLSSIPFYSL